MKVIVKHFPKHHRYHKIFNKNTIKLSYSCIQNMGNVITKHNKKLPFQGFEQPTRMCNCRDKASCPMDQNCLQKCFVYQVQVDSANSRKYYLGTFEDEFKTDITIIPCHSKIKFMKKKLNIQNMFGD